MKDLEQWSLKELFLRTKPLRLVRLVFLKRAFVAIMVFWASIAVTPVTAATIKYSFTGTVNQVSNQLSSTFPISSSTMSGSITVNTTDTNTSSAIIGSYTITNLSLNIRNYTATMGTSGTVQTRNGPPNTDRFEVTVNAPSGTAVNSQTPRIFELQLHGPNSIFASDALPTSSPSIAAFTNLNMWRLIFGNGNSRMVSGVVTAITAVTVVPLPPTIILFGAALVALVSLGAGNWKRNKHLARRELRGFSRMPVTTSRGLRTAEPEVVVSVTRLAAPPVG